MNDERTKQKEVVKCLVEKETIPKNQVDLQLLRSHFERSASRSDQRRRGHSSFCENSAIRSPGGSLIDAGDYVVDHSQPSMAEILDKFRRLERSRQPGTKTGRRWRRSSAEGYDGLRFSQALQGSGFHRRSLEFEDSEEQEAVTPQISDLVAMFRKMEGKKSSRGKGKRRETESYRISGTSKDFSLQKEREPNQRGHVSDGEGEMEVPEEGTVQALLLQWKTLEKPKAKKRRSWLDTQVSREANQRKSLQCWTPAASQKTPVNRHKSTTGFCDKSSVITKHSTITAKTTSVTTNNATGAPQNIKVNTPKTWIVTQKTQVVTPQKALVIPQKSSGVPQKTQGTFHQTGVESHKPDFRNGVERSQSKSKRDSWTFDGSTKILHDHGTPGHFQESPGKDREQEDDDATFDGIAKNMTEKFRKLERRNASSDDVDAPHKRKYKWEVKTSTILGRPQGHPSSTEPTLVAYHIAPATPPSSPEPGHVSDLRQPDVVGHSTATSAGWKSELEEFPLTFQTKNLRAKFEAMPLSSHD